MQEFFYVPMLSYVEMQVENNLNFMISFYYKKAMRKVLDHPSITSGQYKGKIFIDSGAFTYNKVKSEEYENSYIDFINNSNYFAYAPLDDLPAKGKDGKETAKATRENFFKFLPRLLPEKRQKLLYVFHNTEPFEYLRDALEIEVEGEPIKYIALSARMGMLNSLPFDFFDKCYSIIENSRNKDVKIHAFGIQSPTLLKSYPFYSADSSSYIQQANTGGLLYIGADGKLKGIGMGRSSMSTHFDKLGIRERQFIINQFTSLGLDFNKMIVDLNYRAAALSLLLHKVYYPSLKYAYRKRKYLF